MTNLIKRTISGAVFVAVIVAAILVSPYTFGFVFAIFMALCMNEFHKLTNTQADVSVPNWQGIVGGLLLYAGTFWAFVGDAHPTGIVRWLPFVAYALLLIALPIVELFRKASNPLHNMAYYLLGQFVVAVPFSLLNLIYAIASVDAHYFVLALFVTLWMNDTWAFIFGSWLGKHKMFPRVSPKKSWEGFVGGALMSLLTGWVCSLLVPQYSLAFWLIFAETVVIFGTLGDLVESLLKRTVGVKDSGNIIPGHGGALDRFDSMLFAVVPTIFLLILLFQI